MKSIETIPQDIYALLSKGENLSKEDVDELSKNISNALRNKLKKTSAKYKSPPKSVYRMSNLGKGDRYLWYCYRDPDRFSMNSSRLKLIMLYGVILEEILLFLIKKSGHSIEGEQDLIKIKSKDGVVSRGKRDGIIDGVNADIKSMSPFVFTKFLSEQFLKDKEADPHGYKYQAYSYSQASSGKDFKDHDQPAALIGMDKSGGGLHVVKIEDIDQENMSERIDEIKKIVESDEIPPRCYSDIEEGKKGNRRLHANCVHCKYRDKGPNGLPGCWADANGGKGLRVFQYKGGMRKYFSNVVVKPKAIEIKPQEELND